MIGLLSAFAVLLPAPSLQAGVADARADARAGMDLDALDASPGASLLPPWRLQLAGGRPFVGSGLNDNAVRLHAPYRHAAVALGWEQRRSTVHRDDAFVGALQMRRSAWRVGVGARVQRLAFTGYESRWRSELRFGASVALGAGSFVARFIPQPLAATPPRLDCGALWVWHRSMVMQLQYVREPGLAERLRAAFSLRSPALSWHSGYDVATGVVAAGVEAGAARVRFIYAVQSHPELSWSHSWMLELGPAPHWF